jgi:hypothetical protein
LKIYIRFFHQTYSKYRIYFGNTNIRKATVFRVKR